VIAIETQRLAGPGGKLHVRARTFGSSAVYLKVADPDKAGEVHKHAAIECARLALGCPINDVVFKRVHFDVEAGFGAWIAFDKRRG
jgi:hypothetical protein